MKRTLIALAAAVSLPMFALAQGRGGQQPPRSPKDAAPVDLAGYWVSLVTEDWRWRMVTPIKGDSASVPINQAAKKVMEAWDPAKDEADGKQCKAYGAVGVMQRPGRLHITWDDDNMLRMEADAGTQTRIVHFGAPPAQKGEPSWQGYSTGQWQIPRNATIDLGGVGFAPGGAKPPTRTGTLKVVTTNMLPGYIRKNGVPYSGNGVLTEYFNRVVGANGEIYFAVTAMLEDPTYLNQPFVRTYQFKQQPDAKGWEPTPCLPR